METVNIRGSYFILNGELLPVDSFENSASDTVIYEVIRIVKGSPLFFDDHLQRLKNSCAELGKVVNWTNHNFKNEIKELSANNDFFEGNIMLRLLFSNDKYIEQLYFIFHSYPSAEMYCYGVDVGLLQAERRNPYSQSSTTRPS